MSNTFKLHSGDEMPLFGLGTWQSPPDQVYNAIRESIKLGYRHIDCAAIYGNEDVIGKALKDAFDAGDVKREELWITSKLWNSHHQPDDAKEAIAETLKKLQLDYLNLYLIHWPIVMKKEVEKGDNPFLSVSDLPLEITWEAMRSIRDQGLAKNIGVSNFSTAAIDDLISKTGETPAVNQVESHPYLQHNKMKEYCEEKGILITAYCPLGNGNKAGEEKYKNAPHLFIDPTIKELGEKHKVTAAQIMIGWAYQRGVSVIPKSVNAGRLKENLASLNLNLSNDDMDAIAKLERGQRFINGDGWCKDPSPYTVEQLWGDY